MAGIVYMHAWGGAVRARADARTPAVIALLLALVASLRAMCTTKAAVAVLVGTAAAAGGEQTTRHPQLDELWLRQSIVADTAQLSRYRAQFKSVHVMGSEASRSDTVELTQLHTVADELSSGLTRLLGVNITASCCAVPPPGTKERSNGTLHVVVGGRDSLDLGTEGFEIGRVNNGDVHVRALTASGALFGSFRLLSFLQRSLPVPGDCTPSPSNGRCTKFSPYRSIPQMEMRTWDLWDDLSGDVTRGFAGDSLVWPQALWRDPDIEDGPPPTKLFVAPCNATDRTQHWAGPMLSTPGIVSRFINGNRQCVTAEKSPPSVIPCAATNTAAGTPSAPNNKTLFWYNTSALQISTGPLVPGVAGTGRECLDINHALGPDIDTYHCHPLYPGGGGERDFANQQFHIRPVPPPPLAGFQKDWKQLVSVSAADQCLTLRNSFPPSPDAPSPAVISFSERFVQFMRLLKSAGMNGLVLNDVNACYGDNGNLLHSNIITNVSRNLGPTMARFGITPYLCACFGAPLIMSNVTADPLAPAAQRWWRDKADEIWEKWPTFGGFLVKADSEGNVGPLRYNRTEADGANLLARAVAPHDGLVMWRAFVYGNADFGTEELVRQSYSTFKPLDGLFDANVILQIKNGPMDFQIREPLHPLLGALKHTNVMMAVQAAQEYTGQQIHAVNLVTMWSEYLSFDTHHSGPGSTIWKLLSNSSDPKVPAGRKHPGRITGMACVSNFGTFANWTGHVLAGSNAYGFGRLAWGGQQQEESLSLGRRGGAQAVSEEINTEWAQMTFPQQAANTVVPAGEEDDRPLTAKAARGTADSRPAVDTAAAAAAARASHATAIATIVHILQVSRSVYEGYTSPLGIGFIVFGGGDYKAGHGACAPRSPGPGAGPEGEVCPTSPGRRRQLHDFHVAATASSSFADVAVPISSSSRPRRNQYRRRLDLRGGLDHYWVDPCSNYGTSNYSYWGLGCDRTTINQRATPTDWGGTGYAGDYAPANRDIFNDPGKCPTELLLWFHHLPWTHPMPRPANYTPPAAPVAAAADEKNGMAQQWDTLQGSIDESRFRGVQARFAQQVRDAAVMCTSIMGQYERWHNHGQRYAEMK